MHEARGAASGDYAGNYTLGTPGAVDAGASKSVTFNAGGYAGIGRPQEWGGATPFSFEMWLNPKDFGFGRAFSNGSVTVMTSGASLTLRRNYGGLVSGADSVTASNALAPGTWTHVIGTYDGRVLSLYVNGASINSQFSDGNAKPSLASGETLLGTDGSFYFNGAIDDFSVYNRALTPSEVAVHYAAR